MKSNFRVRNPSNKNFGVTISIVIILFAFYPVLFGNEITYYLLLISIVLLFISFFKPNYLSIPNKLWMKFGYLLGLIVSQLTMLLVYFFTFFPIGLIIKLFKKDLLDKSLSPQLDTYWKVRKDQNQNMNNQF